MDFSIPAATIELLQRVREFIQVELIPLEREFSGRPFLEILPELMAKRELVKQLGLWLPQIPREYGGVGLGFLDYAMVCEQLARSPYGNFVFNAQAPDAGNMEILIEFGSEEQQRRWLRPLLDGKIRSCFSMTEPDRPGSNPVWMDTTAVRDGDSYVINGLKWFTSSADGAAFAVVMAVTNPSAPPHERASQLIVPTDTPGFNLLRNISCMGHAGEDWESHAEIRYEDCRVPIENLLGEEGAGFRIAQARLGPGRIHHCMRWIGISERCFELMCQRAAERNISENDKLASKQTIQNWIADSRAEIDAARLLVLHAAWKIDRDGAKQARVEISTIKFFVAEVMMKVIDRAIQVHGALGITDDTILATYYRNERAARIYDGPDEVHRSVVARHILKNYQ
ncbi:MAG: acyl-CoA dehydrogenase family protein [Pirellulaceae bacterium]|nr:acyl-CoA dehydrogenase family protein [Pirellulaceae bacterium]